jgi:hypothetical protein
MELSSVVGPPMITAAAKTMQRKLHFCFAVVPMARGEDRSSDDTISIFVHNFI